MSTRKGTGKRPGSPTPHDLTFKQFLTHPDIARDFILLHLPPELQAVCDLSTLQLESGSFVEPGLRPFFSDVLYSMKTVSGHSGYVHVLIEHQSTPDKQMAFRLLRYAVGAMQRHLDAGHTALPLVIPVLFYAGRRTPYPYSTRWLDAFAEPALAERLYVGHFPLVDVTTIADDKIMAHRSMAALTLLQKHIYRRDLSALIERLAQLLRAEPVAEAQLVALINYLVQTGETSEAEAFVRELARRVPQHGDKLMTIAEQLEQNGIRKGVEMGKREARCEVARSMLQNGIDHRLVSKITGLTEKEVAKLRH
ncbi:Rpn family recombination-promoting nuclease/putative transposase [Pluralibacter gergoviae]|uniref:Rpn family recombination-promoting nuclease/putative transposase n=1 Tax=Pluralibacter gergoviae TaxID=61647 RepID=UPI000BFB32C9|nr:Rpn family recombination-promoting nuclease/putative transposase [Pluralibacter gergoviae]EKZ9514906.1 Rpn family recombination-promoting nuclease/putative transposase [Pluralibacter gergoviae]ELC3016745.1 Rpn family recombination-promoting nuclease/putative transposase [Pluralibacter gergoviae]ELC3022264.1 Rpn family recombination-promoting nuclease/putative transposase [Pluralibacter gergoviae]MCK1065475.1 Rpn family recombination-promoting nuclease/putative transposase [Pluralibacter gerg